MNRQGLFYLPVDTDPKYTDGVFSDYFFYDNVAFNQPSIMESVLFRFITPENSSPGEFIIYYYVGSLNYIIDPHSISLQTKQPTIKGEILCLIQPTENPYNFTINFNQEYSPLLTVPTQCNMIFSDTYENFYITPKISTLPFGVPNFPPAIGFRGLNIAYNLYYPLLQQLSTFDWNNPVNQYKYWYDFIMRTFQNLSEFVQPGIIKDHYGKLLKNGDNTSNGINWHYFDNIEKLYTFYISGNKEPLIRETTALRIIKSPNHKIPQTTFVLKHAPRLNFIVEVCGLYGEYSLLNGLHKTYGNVNTAEVLSIKPYIIEDRQYYTINIQYDTTDFPPYNPNIHGIAVLRSKMYSLDAGSELIDLIAAVNDTWSQINPQTHDWIWGHTRGVSEYKAQYTQPLSNTSNVTYVLWEPLLTYDEVIKEPKETKLMSMITQRNTNYYSCRAYYTNPVISCNLVSNQNVFPGNLDFGIDPFFDTHWQYNIDMNNYMEAAYEVFYGENMTPQYIVAPLGTPPQGYKSLYYVTGYPELYFGLIKKSLTDNKNIVLIISTTWFYDNTKENALENYPYPLVDIYGTMMTYINEQFNPETIIINQSYNFGGFFAAVFAACFGAQRYANKTLQQSNGIPTLRGAGEPIENITNPARLNEARYPYNTALIEPNFILQKYPNGVFVGTEQQPKKVILMTSTKAWSDADLITYYFAGTNGDFNIGGNVQVYILGNNVGGRECGAPLTLAGIGTPKPINTQAKIIRNGQPTSPFRFNWTTNFSTVGISGFNFTSQNSGQFMYFARPHILEPQDMTVFYRDVGLMEPARKYLGKIKPKYRKRETYRDSWLEEAIIFSLYGKEKLEKYRLPAWKENLFGCLY